MAHSPEQLAAVQDSLRQIQEFAGPGYYYHYDEPNPESPTKPYLVLQGPAVDKRTLTYGTVHYTAEYAPYDVYADPPIIWERPLFSAADTSEGQKDGFADPIRKVGETVLRRFNFYKPLNEPAAK
ncbi:MAG: hypothetical protein ACREBW_05845 [Candidatus Micrarchaeaceae archaeon]